MRKNKQKILSELCVNPQNQTKEFNKVIERPKPLRIISNASVVQANQQNNFNDQQYLPFKNQLNMNFGFSSKP